MYTMHNKKAKKRGKGGHFPSDPVSTPFLAYCYFFFYIYIQVKEDKKISNKIFS